MDFAKAKRKVSISPDTLPVTVHDYEFKSRIGSGGFAEVYLVWSLKFKETFVAKVITVDNYQMDAQWKSFTAEVSALSGLNFPNIIRMYDHFRVSNQFVLILEFCPNGSLADKITQKRRLSYSEFQKIAEEITRSVAFCHSKFIAHRDIKPTNILVDRYGRMKLADFGLSLKAPGRILQHALCGSLVFTAPEVLRRQPNNPFQSDVWSLGVLFAVMAQGKSPWVASNAEEMKEKIQNCHYYLEPDVPEDIKEMIGLMLKKDPTQRITLKALLQMPFFQARKAIHHAQTENAMRVNRTWSVQAWSRRAAAWSSLRNWRSSALDLNAKVDTFSEVNE